MIPKTASLKPLDDQGVREDRPTDEVKWAKLYNVSFKRGHLVQRPGMRVVNYGLIGTPSPIVAIDEGRSRREDLLTEILRPNADGTHGEWISTDGSNVLYTEVDEAVVDDSDYMYTSVVDARGSLEFANLTETYTEIWQVTLVARLSCASLDEDEVGTIEVYSKWNNLLGTIQVASVGTPPNWIYWAHPMGGNPASPTGKPWTESLVNSMGVYFKYKGTVEIIPDEYAPIADGSDAGWTRVDYTQVDMYLQVDEHIAGNDGDTTRLVAGGSNSLVTFIAPSNFVTLFDDVNRGGIGVALAKSSEKAEYQLYVKSGGTRYNWGDRIVVPYGSGYVYDIVWLDANPITDAAFVPADFNGLEFGIQTVAVPLVAGGVGQRAAASMSAISVFVDGTKDRTADFRVDHVFLRVDGMFTDENVWSHVHVSADEFLRGDDETGGDTVVDVSGSVTAATVPSTHHWDHADFEGQLYFVNGKDQIYRYPDASNEFEHIAAGPFPTGRTIESFADRIILGDVLESGQRVRDQLRWCAFRDPSDWSSLSAGDFRIRQTKGAVVKIKNLLTVMVAYKEVGIYNCIHRADPNSPIYVVIQDPETGLVAMASLTAIGGKGVAEHAFLGKDLNGYNVFKYNGDIATPIGQPIVDALREDHTPQQLRNAFAVTDPDSELYLLFISEGLQHFPEQCYVFSDRLQTWLGQWHFPVPISSAGVWTISRDQTTGSTHLMVPTLVLGTITSQMYMLDPDQLNDHVVIGPDIALDGPILQEVETGDLPLGGVDKFAKAFSLWLSHQDAGIVEVDLSLSQDGGVSFLTALSHHIGTVGGSSELRVESRSVSLDASRRIRFKLSNNRVDQQLDLTDIGLEAAALPAKRP